MSMHFYGSKEHQQVSKFVNELQTKQRSNPIRKEGAPGILNGVKGMFINYYDPRDIECRFDGDGNCIEHDVQKYLAEGFVPSDPFDEPSKLESEGK
jgi:hypothetical protein